MNTLRILLVILAAYLPIVSPHALAKTKKPVPMAPLPGKVVAAKKVFLSNGGGNDLAYDAFYAAIKQWPRYEIVDTSTVADIIMQISYVTEDHARGFGALLTRRTTTRRSQSPDC